MTQRIEIESVAHGGHGVGRVDGQVHFVRYGLPGDVVEATVEKETKGIQWCHIDQVLEPSPHRAEPPCPHFGMCGGCTWLHFAYPGQAEWKRRIVADCLERIAGVETDAGWAEDPEFRLHYRTRAEFQGDDQKRGFYALKSHRVVDIAECPLCHWKLNEALTTLRETRYKGPVELTVNPEGSEVLCWSKRPHRRLHNAFPLANSPGGRGKRHWFEFDGLRIVNGAFSQSSLLLNRVLVRTVQHAATEAGNVLDLYCGNGNLSMGLHTAERVVGMDHDAAAVRAADKASADLPVPAQYTRAKTADFAKALREQHWDTIVLDPPRTGAKEIAPDLANAQAERIVYVSCDPATLARDLKTVLAGGWRLDSAVAVDMFPQTPHIETVCRLVRA